MKNTQAKMVKEPFRDNAYEVWQSLDETWTWYVLKKWQADDKQEYARWFCLVDSPFVKGELGDTYVEDIKSVAKRIR